MKRRGLVFVMAVLLPAALILSGCSTESDAPVIDGVTGYTVEITPYTAVQFSDLSEEASVFNDWKSSFNGINDDDVGELLIISVIESAMQSVGALMYALGEVMEGDADIITENKRGISALVFLALEDEYIAFVEGDDDLLADLKIDYLELLVEGTMDSLIKTILESEGPLDMLTEIEGQLVLSGFFSTLADISDPEKPDDPDDLMTAVSIYLKMNHEGDIEALSLSIGVDALLDNDYQSYRVPVILSAEADLPISISGGPESLLESLTFSINVKDGPNFSGIPFPVFNGEP